MSGTEIIFRERLTPRPYVYLVVVALIAMISIAYGVPFGAPVGWLVFIGASILALWALLATSPIIEVTPTHLRAGTACIERRHVTSVQPLDPASFHLVRGRNADPRRYSLMRAWHSGSGVVIAIEDARDPHPAWILTTARPERLAAALA
ncbi:MAG: DUF3093 domain-containing protein [Candidatus Nanopelagicales bacterium]